MKHIKLLLINIFCVCIVVTAAAQNSKFLRPKNVKSKIVTVINGKNRTYYPVTYDYATVVTVRGPGKIKVITRAKFTPVKTGLLDYIIFYSIDGREKLTYAINNVKKSGIAKYKDDSHGIPGVRKDFEIDLGMGEHTIEFWRSAESPFIAARYIFKPGKLKKQKWISLCPSAPNEPIDLITKENIIHYYRFSGIKPLKVKVNGPTTLRVLNRIENHYYMKGRINYRLQVVEDGTIKNTYQLNSVRSEVTSYKNDDQKIPGKAKEIVIKVPSGSHKYEIIPLDKNFTTVLGRILFPQKDVKLEE